MNKRHFAILALILAPLVSPKAAVRLRFGEIDSAQTTIDGNEHLYIIENVSTISGDWRKALLDKGATIRGYLSDNAYLIEAEHEAIEQIAESLPHRYLGPFLAKYKYAHPVEKGGKEYLVSLFDEAKKSDIIRRLSSLEDVEVVFSSGEIIRARFAEDKLDTIASWDEVAWIDISVVNNSKLYLDRASSPILMNFRAPNIIGANKALSGKGETIAIADTGLDTGDFSTLHEDIKGRVIRAYAIGRDGDWSDPMGHGTHICGAALGNGSLSRSGRFRAPAYEANLIIQSLMGEGGEEIRPTNLKDLFLQAYLEEDGIPGARIHSNSWGEGREPGERGADFLGVYIEDCRVIDKFVFEHPDILILFASGNDAADLDKDGVVDLDSLNSQACAKNCLSVGGAENFRASPKTYGQIAPQLYSAEPIASDNPGIPFDKKSVGIAAFSGRGPCDDGRIKPDIIAPATMISSIRSQISPGGDAMPYVCKSGTSMATPIVAGCAALIRQYLRCVLEIPNPDSATIKALLILGARSVAPGQYGDGESREVPTTSPNPVEGWGLVDISKSIPDESRKIDVIDGDIISDGEERIYAFESEAGKELVAVLAYTDAPATMASKINLVNNLDLILETPSGEVIHPNNSQSPDRLNNVEKIILPSPEKGVYVFKVKAKSIAMPMDKSLTRGAENACRYSLVVSGAIHRADV